MFCNNSLQCQCIFTQDHKQHIAVEELQRTVIPLHRLCYMRKLMIWHIVQLCRVHIMRPQLPHPLLDCWTTWVWKNARHTVWACAQLQKTQQLLHYHLSSWATLRWWNAKLMIPHLLKWTILRWRNAKHMTWLQENKKKVLYYEWRNMQL